MLSRAPGTDTDTDTARLDDFNLTLINSMKQPVGEEPYYGMGPQVLA